MKYLHFIYCYLFMFSYANSQEIQVLSADEKEIIPSVAVLFMINDSIVGATPTEDGKVILQLDKEVNFIELHAFGYQIKKIHRKDITNQIFLEDTFVKLEEIIISSKKKKTLKNKTQNLGYPLKYKNHFANVDSGLEIVTLINNKLQKSKKIKSFLFRLGGYGGVSRILKIAFYSNENGKIGKPLLEDEQKQIFILKFDQIKVKLDISNLNCVIPKEGIFIGLEYIGCIDNNKKILANEQKQNVLTCIPLLKTKEKNAITYARSRFNENFKEWKNIRKEQIFLSWLLSEEQHFVPPFNIEVYK